MYPATSREFDFKNCQMLFVFISKYRMFENELIPLHPQYNVRMDQDGFIVELNDDYVDIASEYRLDVLALCGRNGTGKSSFLEMLRGRYGSNGFTLCWIDHAGEIASNKEIRLRFCQKPVEFPEIVHHFSLSNLCGNQNLGEENSVQRSLLDVLSVDPDLFQLHDRPVFDGFHLDTDRAYLEFEVLGENLAKHLGFEERFGDFTKIIRYHPLFHVFSDVAQDSAFAGIINRYLPDRKISFQLLYRWLRDADSDKIESEIRNLMYIDGDRGERLTMNPGGRSVINEPNWMLYSIDQLPELKELISNLSDKIDVWIDKKIEPFRAEVWKAEQLNLQPQEGQLPKMTAFRPYQSHGDRLFYLEDFSSGERYQIKILFDLAPKIMPEYSCWFYDDDLEEFLHPEWRRQLISKILSTYRKFTERIAVSRNIENYRKRKSTYIISTHSPFVLSDLPKECVLQFRKDSDGRTRVTRSTENSFAGNIGEMFYTEFFMDSTIGEFARQKITSAITKLEQQATPQELAQIRKLFEMVGDDVLKNLLLEKLAHAENSH